MRKSVLLVEDDEDACLLFKEVLANAGYDVKHYLNGNDFFRSSNHLADLYILDICLPGIDGIALTKYLRTREEFRHAPILIISSNHAIKNKAHKAGATAFAPKPFQLSQFIGLVRDLMNRNVGSIDRLQHEQFKR